MTDFESFNAIAHTKFNMFKNDPKRFFTRSILAGLYLGVATILSYTLAIMFDGPIGKLFFSFAFGIGLVLIVLLGSELFTGNCFTTMFPVYHKELRFLDVLPMWLLCYVGNFIGISLVSFLYVKSGTMSDGLHDYIIHVVSAKLDFNVLQLFIKGILCNFIVCVAAYAGMKIKDDTAKILVMIVVVAAFVLPGFEHSIANMGTFTLGFASAGHELAFSHLFGHMGIATLGNIIGGSIMLAYPVYYITKPREVLN